MAKSLKERCDTIIGEAGADFMAIASYKANEGTDQEEVRYHYGVYFDYPDFTKATPEDTLKMQQGFIDRLRSVASAPFKAKITAGEMSVEDVKAWAASFNGDNALVRMNEVKERAKGEAKVSGVTPLIQASRDVLELGLIAARGLDATSIDKAALKEIRAEVRQNQKDNTARWQWALAKGEKELANRMKKTADMPD